MYVARPAPTAGANTSFRDSTPVDTSTRFHTSGRSRYPAAVSGSTSSSSDATRSWTSMQPLAASPGTEVDPT